ncbi:MAG: crotonase/enoyl-CoA hydratase family protein, partial [Erythrobacter sp.]
MDSGVSRAIPLSNDEELFVESARHAAIPQELLDLGELDVLYDDAHATLWTFMRPEGRPSFTPPMLHDFERWQELIPQGFGEGKVPLRYLVLGSRAPDVFCFGGDLALFEQLIRNRDREGLVNYGHRCCAILDRNIRSLGLPMLTIGLVQGAALGGGFEALLSFDFIVAERTATFGLPEIMFGLFPGMGAHALLARKLGSAAAERLILSNETYTAEQMFELGLVHELAEPGDGINACRQFIKRAERRHAGLVGSRRAMKRAWNLEL